MAPHIWACWGLDLVKTRGGVSENQQGLDCDMVNAGINVGAIPRRESQESTLASARWRFTHLLPNRSPVYSMILLKWSAVAWKEQASLLANSTLTAHGHCLGSLFRYVHCLCQPQTTEAFIRCLYIGSVHVDAFLRVACSAPEWVKPKCVVMSKFPLLKNWRWLFTSQLRQMGNPRTLREAISAHLTHTCHQVRFSCYICFRHTECRLRWSFVPSMQFWRIYV